MLETFNFRVIVEYLPLFLRCFSFLRSRRRLRQVNTASVTDWTRISQGESLTIRDTTADGFH